jgi:hypothetical protein
MGKYYTTFSLNSVINLCHTFHIQNDLKRKNVLYHLCFLEVGAEKTEYMTMSHHWTTGQNHYKKAANKFSKNVAKFKYMGMMVPNNN